MWSLQGCVATAPPKPSSSERFVTEGAGFLVEGSSVRYGMIYRLTKPYPDSLYVVVEFENPKPGGRPLRTETLLKAGETMLKVQSPPLPGIENDRVYATTLTAYRDHNHRQLVARHEQPVMFRMPEKLLPQLRQRGVVLF